MSTFYNTYQIQLDDLTDDNIDHLKYKDLQRLHKEALLDLRLNEIREIRTEKYWEIRDRYQVPLTRRVNQMKLLLLTYVNYKNGRDTNWNYLLHIIADERTNGEVSTPKKLTPKTDFYDNS